jgi:hypothetical protein
MSKPMSPRPILRGEYTAVFCRSTETGKEWWRVYRKGSHDGLSDHATSDEAKAAITRYQDTAAVSRS